MAEANRQKGIFPKREEEERGEWHVPAEETEVRPRTVARGVEAQSVTLERGQHRVQISFPYSGPDVHRTGYPQSVPFEGEYKRIWVYKMDLRQVPGETTTDGRPMGRLTMVFRVLDNPLPVVPIVWAVSGIASLGAGWLFVDKVESFTESTTGKVLSIAAAALSIIVAWNVFT